MTFTEPVPIVDFSRLVVGETDEQAAATIHRACTDSGFFYLMIDIKTEARSSYKKLKTILSNYASIISVVEKGLETKSSAPKSNASIFKFSVPIGERTIMGA